MKSIYLWAGRQVHSKWADFLFALLSFLEGFVFLPISVILILYCLERHKLSFYYAAAATLFSALGGLVGYYIGFRLWESLIFYFPNLFVSKQNLMYMIDFYKNHQKAAVLLATLTPLPYNAVTISAGFCKLSVMPFIIFSVIGHGIRFFYSYRYIFFWGAG